MDAFSLFAKLTLDSSEYDKGLSKAESDANSFGSKIGGAFGKVGGAIGGALKAGISAVVTGVTAATTAVTAFAGASVKTGMEFDSAMSQVAATMGLTVTEMTEKTGTASTAFGEFQGNLREFAQFLGKNTAFSATEAAEALNYMALAGYSVQESMNMLPNVLSLASAGNFDLARASDMVTDTQTAFGISSERTTKMVDEMAKAASTGNTSVEQLGDAFLVVGGLAKELNGGMVTLADGTQKPVDGVQELEIALTAMANAGVKGSEAGTHMRNMLLKLSSPTEAGAVALDKMGVSVFDTEGKMRSLSDIFGDLSSKMDEMTQEEKLDIISKIFNTRDIASDWDDIGASILDAQGAAAKMAATQLDNLEGDITLFKSALEGAKIVVSDQLTPSLRKFVQFGTDGLGRLTSAFQTGGLSGAMAEFGKLLSEGLTMVTAEIPKFVSAGVQLMGALGQGIMDNLDVLTDSAVDIINILSSAIISGLPNLLSAGSQIVNALLEAIIQVLPEAAPAITEFIVGLAKIIADNAELVIDAAIQIAAAIGDGLVQAAPILAEKAPDIIKAIADGIKQNPEAIIGIAPFVMGNLVTAFSGVMSLLKPIGSNIAQYLGTSLQTTIPNAISSVGPTISSALSSVGQFATADMGATMASGGAAAVGTAFAAIAGSVAAFFGGAELGKKIGGWLFPDDKELYDSYSGISGTFKLLKETVVTIGEEISYAWDGFKASITGAWDEIKTSVSEGWTGLKEGLAEGWENIKQGAVDAWEGVKSAVTTTFEFLMTYPLIENLKELIVSTFGNVKETLTGIWDGIREAAVAGWELIKASILAPVLLIIDLVTGDFEKLHEDAGKTWNKMSESAKNIWVGIKNIKTNTTEAWINIKASAKEAWENVKKTVVDKVTELKTRTQKLIEDLKNALPAIWENVKSTAINKWEETKNRVVETARNLYEGVKEKIMNIPTLIQQEIGKAVEWLKNLPSQALTWGRDLIQSFVEGIREKVSKVKDVAEDVASAIRDVLHFSEPDKGPLADFHTYAPDMVNLFIKGVKDNTKKLQDQIEKSFDFGNVIMDSAFGTVASDDGNTRVAAGGSPITINVYGAEGQDVRELADIVNDRILHMMDQTGAVYA